MLVFVLNQAQKANTGKIQTPVYENVREFGELRKDYQERLNVACKADAGDGLAVSRVLSEICHEIGMIRVAGASGIERTTFYRLLSGKTDLRVSNALKVIRVLGCRLPLR